MFKNIIIVFLLTITAFSVYKYISYQKRQQVLTNILDRVKQRAENLESQTQNILEELQKQKEQAEKLIQEKTVLKDYLSASRRKIDKLFVGLDETEKLNEQLNSEASSLKQKYAKLLKDKQQLTQQNQALESKLSSIPELKKAIRELKRAPRKITKRKSTTHSDKAIIGNLGYLIKNGLSTYATKARIEIIPFQEK